MPQDVVVLYLCSPKALLNHLSAPKALGRAFFKPKRLSSTKTLDKLVCLPLDRKSVKRVTIGSTGERLRLFNERMMLTKATFCYDEDERDF